MMALDLFVVVVGVDPRWLVHALRDEYAAMETNPDKENNNRDKVLLQATPQTYLEKIFQIPFTVRPMTPDGYRDLLASIWKSHEPEEAGGREQGESSKDDEGSIREKRSDEDYAALRQIAKDTMERRKGEVLSQGAFESGRRPDSGASGREDIEDVNTIDIDSETEQRYTIQRLEIPEDERKFLLSLHEFVPNPRATIRISNIYSLLRALMSEGDYHDFASKNYKTAATLLGILTGFPDQAFQVFKEIIDSDEGASFSDFVASLDPSASIDRLYAEPETENEKEQWTRLHVALENLIAKHPELPKTLEPFQRYIPYVARFNFKSTKILRKKSAV